MYRCYKYGMMKRDHFISNLSNINIQLRANGKNFYDF